MSLNKNVDEEAAYILSSEVNLSKLKPIYWYARVGNNRYEKNLITGVITVTPLKGEDDAE